MSCCLETPAQSLPASPVPQVQYHQTQYVHQTPRAASQSARNSQPAQPDVALVCPPAVPSFSRERPLPEGCQRFSLRELREATGNFAQDAWLGEGGFGQVYRGTLEDGTSVAIKRLDRGGLQGDREFEVEINVLAHLRHKHLVTLRGACTDGKNRMAVFDFMPGGSLRDNLNRRMQSICSWQAPRTNLLWPARIEIALGAAKGLRFLHEGIEPGMIHRDVKSSNFLLDGQGHARIADFGLAIHTGDKCGKEAANYQTPLREDNDDILTGTYGYTAPETSESGVMSQKSDVYAFGVVLLELLTALEPVDTSRTPQSLVDLLFPALSKDFPDVDEIKKFLDPVIPLESVPVPQLMWFCQVAAGCLQPRPENRLRMSDVVAYLSKLDAWIESPLITSESGRRMSTSDRRENGKYTLRSLMDDEPLNNPPANGQRDLVPLMTALPQTFQDGAISLPPLDRPAHSMPSGNPFAPLQEATPAVQNDPLQASYPDRASYLWPTMPATPVQAALNTASTEQENVAPNRSTVDANETHAMDEAAWHHSLGISSPQPYECSSPVAHGNPGIDSTYSPLRSSITGISEKGNGRGHHLEAYSDQAHFSQDNVAVVGPLQDGLQSRLDKVLTIQEDRISPGVLFAKDYVEQPSRQGSPAWVSFSTS